MLKHFFCILLLALLCLLYSCATYGPAPIGGAQDVTAPKFIGSTPPNAATYFNTKQVRLNFNEYIQLKNTSEIFISPQVKGISYSVNLRQVSIDISDTLKPDVTYTVNFRNSLADVNEGNPIKNFQYVFSLGSSIDTSYLTATVLDAYTLAPVPDASILLFKERKDSLYLIKEPQYIGVTDSNGIFFVNHIKEGCYFVYAIAEKTRSYSVEANEERIAYSSECIKSSAGDFTMAEIIINDTAVITDTAAVATNVDTNVTDTAAAALAEIAAEIAAETAIITATAAENVLLLYQDREPKLFLKEGNFDRRGTISLKFNYPIIDTLLSIFIADTVNTITIVAENKMSATIFVKEMDVTQALVTVNYDIYSDTLDLLLTERQIKATDTTSFRYSVSGNKDKLLSGDSVILTFSMPLFHYLGDTMLPYTALGEEDTITGFVKWKQISPTTASITYDWKNEYDYKVTIPRCTFSDIFDRTIDTSYLALSTLSLDIFGELGMELSGIAALFEDVARASTLASSSKYFLQIVDAKNIAVKQIPVTGDGIYDIKFINPGEYFVWLYEDKNSDGIWTAGDFYKQIQPERRWIYKQKIKIEADWRIEEKWQF